jgi:hypothetical protein
LSGATSSVPTGFFGQGGLGGKLYDTAKQGMDIYNSFNQLAGPQGGLTTGDPDRAMQGAQGLYGGISNFGSAFGSPKAPNSSQPGMPKDFSQLPPEVQAELIKRMQGG